MRAVTYVIPVIMLSVALNIPKFFETEIIYVKEEQNNMTFTYVTYDLTDLRKDPDYIRYHKNLNTTTHKYSIEPFVDIIRIGVDSSSRVSSP